MNENLVIIGPESSILCYNLNKQYSNLKKLIVTRDQILDAFENNRLRKIIESLKENEIESYLMSVKELDVNNVLEGTISDSLYQNIIENLNRLYGNLTEIKLRDYNFMHAVSNTKYTIILRTECFTISRYYIEKGMIVTSIKNILKSYLKFEGNSYRISRLDNFQIEIFESEEVFKHIYLKKEGDSLILSSSFGFQRETPFDYDICPELYYSKGEQFNFFKNKQNTARIRDHTKFEENEINPQEKVLTNEDLIMINNNTKNINDASIEMYINKKGVLRIVNLGILENSIGEGNEKGFAINKSSKNYDRISVTTLRENYSDETPNPKYLLIRNEEEIRELVQNLDLAKNFDGIILSSNFYNPILDRIGCKLDIDLIFLNTPISKSLDLKVNFDTLEVEGAKTQSINSPFSTIISKNNKNDEKDELLERLKNLNLNEPMQRPQENRPNPTRTMQQGISNLAQGIISSPNSSTKKLANNWPDAPKLSNLTESGKKRSAIELLASKVLENDSKPIVEVEEKVAVKQPELNNEIFMQNINSKELEPISSETLSNFSNTIQNSISVNTQFLTRPNINSNKYFVDSNSIAQVRGGDIFFLLTNPEDMRNPNIKYVLPISIPNTTNNNPYLLVNNVNDFFLIDNHSKKHFINISQIDDTLYEKFLNKAIEMLGTCSVICNKKHLETLKKYKSKLENIFIKDLESDEEFNKLKNNFFGTVSSTSQPSFDPNNFTY